MRSELKSDGTSLVKMSPSPARMHLPSWMLYISSNGPTCAVLMIMSSYAPVAPSNESDTKRSATPMIMVGPILSASSPPCLLSPPPMKSATPTVINETLMYLRSGYFLPMSAPMIITGMGLHDFASTCDGARVRSARARAPRALRAILPGPGKSRSAAIART